MLLSQTIVEAVAEREEVDPEDLESPLYEAVNPDALNSLFEDDHSSTGAVSFMYKGYRVVVDSSDAVRPDVGEELPFRAVP